jgi:hypothetical protein
MDTFRLPAVASFLPTVPRKENGRLLAPEQTNLLLLQKTALIALIDNKLLTVL